MAKFVPQAEMSVSEQAQVRRDKLAALKENGKNPFEEVKYDVTATSKEIVANWIQMGLHIWELLLQLIK